MRGLFSNRYAIGALALLLMAAFSGAAFMLLFNPSIRFGGDYKPAIASLMILFSFCMAAVIPHPSAVALAAKKSR